MLLLDIALDNYFRLCIERTDKTALKGDDLTEMIHLVLRNAVIATDSEDLRQVGSNTWGLQSFRVMSNAMTFHNKCSSNTSCIEVSLYIHTTSWLDMILGGASVMPNSKGCSQATGSELQCP